jgi:DNA-binding transcriptional LysR family regulator
MISCYDSAMNMNLLKVFHTVAQLLSFTRAAEELHLTQPGISKHIKTLEEQFGVPLFDRLGKRILLTQAGEILHKATSSAFAQLNEARQHIHDLTGLMGGTLRIGGSVTIATYILPGMLARYKAFAPGVEIAVETGFSRQIVEKVLENSLEVGFVGHYQADARLIHHKFQTERMALIVSPQHPLAGRKEPVQLTELTGQSFLISKKGSGTWRLLSDLFDSKGIVLKDLLEMGTTEGAKQAVEAGLGISIVSRHALGDGARVKLREVPLESEGLKRDLYLVYCKDRYLSHAARAFLALFNYP